ncbi:MAG: bifunctional 5,10-methylenetetrahydrofolate dehydrogenase/5,10-methenyltetrahydrofolate cyclohydrolase [Candidatus Taylorbacteria bacterium]
MTIIIDGRKTRETRLPLLKNGVAKLSFMPKLAIIQVGERADSTSFIRAKKLFAEKIGVDVLHKQFSEGISRRELLDHIESLNNDDSINGIIVQLPLPSSIDKFAVIEAIDPDKDVDALTSANVAKWSHGEGIMPATARGIKELLDSYGFLLKGKNVTVVGRSDLVGKPIAAMCETAGAKVTVCHSQTADLVFGTKEADILIVATGKPGLIRVEHVNPDQVVIDVGISRIGTERLVGDVDFAAVSGVVRAISPVPGGVGAMTVLALFENLIDLCDTRR